MLNRADVHHLYPKQHLKQHGHSRSSYNQIANFVIAQSEINIAIGARPPETYFAELAVQCNGGAKKYGGISERVDMLANLSMNCIPEGTLEGKIMDYADFLQARRKLMALKIKAWFETL